MKVKDHDQMVRYLTSTGEFSKNRKKPEVKPKEKPLTKSELSMVDHINRVQHMYEDEPLNENNKRRDHWEHLKKTGKLLEPAKQEEQRLKTIEEDYGHIITTEKKNGKTKK